MARRSTHFELYTVTGDRKILESTYETEEEAINRAKTLAMRNPRSIDALKVFKETTNQLGRTATTEVFHHTIPKPKTEPEISALDEVAPVCSSYEDMMKVEARIVFRRLLRPYLEKIDATPLEATHLFGLLKRMMDVGTVFQAATGRAGMMQAKLNGESARKNMAKLFEIADKGRALAEKADKMRQFFPAEMTVAAFDSVHPIIDKRAEDGDRPFLRRHQMARLLATVRGDGPKLDLVIQLLAKTQDDQTYHLCDHAMADLCLATGVIQDMFGPHPCLGAFVAELCLLLTGRLPVQDREADDPLRVLCTQFKAKKLGQTRKVLLERMLRELNGANPLDRKEPEKDRIWINLVAKAALQPDGTLVGGNEVVRALHRRRTYALAKAAEERGHADVAMLPETDDPKQQLEELLAG